MNRKKAPRVTKSQDIMHKIPDRINLANSLPVYIIQAGSEPVVKIDLVFRAGSWWQPKPLVASSTVMLLSEGTRSNSAGEIAKKIDFLGAYLNTSSDRDNSSITLYSLTRHLVNVIPLLAEIIKYPVFPEKEFRNYLERRKQSFMVERTRVNNIARERFSAAIYGSVHPYGRTISETDFGNICRDDVRKFHEKFYIAQNCSIIVSGNYDEDKLFSLINSYFGGEDWLSGNTVKTMVAKKRPSGTTKIFVPQKNSVQTAIRIGRELFNKKHYDYPGLMVLNSILGGHFGSRLMQNIREDKGFTYGIGSVLIGLKNSGYLSIGTETGNDFRSKVIEEIYRELDKLCSHQVTKKELELTRAHMFGQIARAFDGPFATSESVKSLIEYETGPEYFDKMVTAIRSIEPSNIMDLASKYLNPNEMYEVAAGKR